MTQLLSCATDFKVELPFLESDTYESSLSFNQSSAFPHSNCVLCAQIGAVRVMSSDAQLVVISIPAANNDLVVGLVGASAAHDLVGELVGVLANRFKM